MSPTPRPGLARIWLVLGVLVGTQNDPLMALGHAATPPNVQTHHRQPFCGCSVPRLPHFGPLGVKLAHILPQSVFAGTERQSGPIRPLADRNEVIRVQNIHRGVACDVPAHSGELRRALLPSGGHFVSLILGNQHLVSGGRSGTKIDPLGALGHAAPPPNAQAHHRQPLCGCFVPRAWFPARSGCPGPPVPRLCISLLVADHRIGGGPKCTTAPPKRGTQLLWARGKGAVQFICPGRQRGVVKMNCGGAVGTR